MSDFTALASPPSIDEVPFYSDSIAAIRDQAGRGYVVIRRICENLGIDFTTQLVKLKEACWATIGMIPTVAEDGKLRELAVIPLDRLPMWLAQIHPSKVAPELREKIKRYQCEAADVLGRHFIGSAPTTLPDQPTDPLELAIQMNRQMAAFLEGAIAARNEALQAKALAEHADATAIRAETKAEAALIAQTGDVDFMTLKGFCKVRGIRLGEEDYKKAGQVIARHCRSAGIPIETVKDTKWGSTNAYRLDVLEQWAAANRQLIPA